MSKRWARTRMIDAVGKSLMYAEVYFAMCFGSAPIQVKRRIKSGASCF